MSRGMAQHEDGPNHDVETLEFPIEGAAHEILTEPKTRIIDQERNWCIIPAEPVGHAR